MTTSRDWILKHIRQALGRRSDDADADQTFAALTRQPGQPVQSPLSDDLIASFTRAAQASAADVHEMGALDNLPQWIRQRSEQLGQQVPLAFSPEMARVAMELPSFGINEHVEQSDTWGIVKACAGIAETGTVVSVSEDCPSGLLFLVERLIVVLDKADVVAYQEDVWHRLRQRFNGELPRAVNLVTGPSRTADVEQIIQLGAHGPRWVDYVLYGDTQAK